MRKLERAGLDNLWHVSERIYSGAQPNGDEAFANLRKLGVETIVSVDGARPNVEAARKAGLRYIHVPIGYDGISQQAGASLARVVKEIRGSIYIHCHHGRHRAPAAAAVASIVDGGVDDPRRILEVAGTSPRYTGLWRDVAAYQPPPHDSNLPALVEVAEIESLTAAMAKIDRIADNLSLCRNAKWEIPADHPDVVAEEQALLLKESFREAARNVPPDQSTQLKEWLTAAEATAAALENSLVDGRFDEATRLLVKTTQDCRRCHEKHRN